MNSMLPLFFLLSADDKDSNKKQQLVESVLPSMVPGPPAQRLAMAAVVADGQITTARRREETIAAETVSAIKIAVAKSDKKLADADLTGLTALSPVVARVPALRQQVDAVAQAADQQQQAAVEQAVEQKTAALLDDVLLAIQKIRDKGFKTLTQAEAEAFTTLAPALNRQTNLKNVLIGDGTSVIVIPPSSGQVRGQDAGQEPTHADSTARRQNQRG